MLKIAFTAILFFLSFSVRGIAEPADVAVTPILNADGGNIDIIVQNSETVPVVCNNITLAAAVVGGSSEPQPISLTSGRFHLAAGELKVVEKIGLPVLEVIQSLNPAMTIAEFVPIVVTNINCDKEADSDFAVEYLDDFLMDLCIKMDSFMLFKLLPIVEDGETLEISAPFKSCFIDAESKKSIYVKYKFDIQLSTIVQDTEGLIIQQSNGTTVTFVPGDVIADILKPKPEKYGLGIDAIFKVDAQGCTLGLNVEGSPVDGVYHLPPNLKCQLTVKN